MDEKQTLLTQLSATVPQSWSSKIQCKIPQGWEICSIFVLCQLALIINLWKFILISMSFYPFMDLHKKIPSQEYRSKWITERKEHTGTFQREQIMLHTILGKNWEQAAQGFNWEMLKQKSHYKSRGRTQGKDTGKPASKEEIRWMEKRIFFFWCCMT